MNELDDVDREKLIADIATRAGTASELAKWYDVTKEWLVQFVEDNRTLIEAMAERLKLEEPEEAPDHVVTPTQLDELWITKKFERLKRIQGIAERLQKDAGYDAMAAREFRSYLTLAANELGQLLHRGAGEAGDGDVLSVNIQGVDMETLR